MSSATNFVSYFTPILWFNKPSKELNFKSFHFGNFHACLLYYQEGLLETVRSAMCFCFVSFLSFIGVIAFSVY